ncbi:trehalose-phosphatase [Antrihabitans sp. YC2-6]|nr:trehalose-phosphatase [Antrihabitans sp. YC2-6]
MDGVVTDTATVHAHAWAEVFDAFMGTRAASADEDHAPFTTGDYKRYVDGKARNAGIVDFLASRGISLVLGNAEDQLADATVCGLGNRKNELFRQRIAHGGVRVFAGVVALVAHLRKAGIKTAVFTASRNGAIVLRAAGLDELFDVTVDGVDAQECNLAGKPDPAVLLEAVGRTGAQVARAVVIEDSEAGVAAGRNGGFALVIGVDSAGGSSPLRECGADTVVADLAEVVIRENLVRSSDLPHALTEDGALDPTLRGSRPAVFLDYDGTLSDIVNDPDSAVLADGCAAELSRLAQLCPVAVISGRDLADIRARVALPGIWYSGSHGFELIGPGGEYYENEAALAAIPDLARAVAGLRESLSHFPGVLLEHKRFTIAVHYRNVAAETIEEIVGAVAAVASATGLRLTTGRKVVELRPNVDWGKGDALCWVLAHIVGPDKRTPLYIGDDLTDEDAFDAVAQEGVGVVVRNADTGDRPSAARLAVDSTGEVREVLAKLADRLERVVATCHADTWTFSYEGYDAESEKLREALCTTGNGLFATRGCAPEARAGEYHYPGTYAAGVYNRLLDRVSGKIIDNESIVNLPNWLPVTFRTEGPRGAWFDLDRAELLDYCQHLDLKRAVLQRRFRFRDSLGQNTAVVQRRFVSMQHPHVCALETTVVPEDWSGMVEFRSTVNGAVRNTNVERYRELSSDHLQHVESRQLSDDSVLFVVTTNQSRIPVAVAARNTLWRGAERVCSPYRLVDESTSIGHEISVDVTSGQPVSLEKIATVFTGRDRAISEPADEAARMLGRIARFDDLLSGHELAWKHIWAHADIQLEGHDEAQRIVRLHILHLMQTVSRHTADVDAGVPARGLHGEAYRGHVFWDELFVLPVLNLRLPALSESLLRYRFRRLPEARRLAAEAGYRGAMFPWQSGSDGREESQQLHLNPRSGRWVPDSSQRAHHIGAAIAYNVWQFYQVTGDLDFLADVGAEMLVEIARFYASLATYDDRLDRYVIRGVIGPDEFHSGYPGRPLDGIDNNAYTNVMAVWVIVRALDALDVIPSVTKCELLETLGVDADEMTRWEAVSRQLYVPFHDGVISQFEGYDQLAELDWEKYRGRYGEIGRLDRILEAEGDDVNLYKVSKQADVKMLFYLLSSDELRELFDRLGYKFDAQTIPRTIDYYMARTSHGSTLSAVVQSWVLARANRSQAIEFFDRVLASDIADVQGGTTAEGIHLAAMAGSIDLLQRCFSGLETRGDRLVLCPNWPTELGALAFPIYYRGHRLVLRIVGTEVQVTATEGTQRPIEIECRGHVAALRPGDTVHLK